MSRPRPNLPMFLFVTDLSPLIYAFISVGLSMVFLAIWHILRGATFSSEWSRAFAGLVILAFPAFSLGKKFHHLGYVFATGWEIPAKVVDVESGFLGGKIIFEYEHSDWKYRASGLVALPSKFAQFQQGQQIILFVNSDNIEEAFIRDLYV